MNLVLEEDGCQKTSHLKGVKELQITCVIQDLHDVIYGQAVEMEVDQKDIEQKENQ